MNDARDRCLVPDWQLERFRLRELPAEDMNVLAGRLATDDALRRRLAQLDTDDRAILGQLPTRTVAAQIRSRCEQPSPRPGPRLLSWQPALGAAAVLLVVAAATLLGPERGPSSSVAPPLEPTRIKGLRPQVLLFRKTPAGAEPLTQASVARAGDVVQLAYQAAGRRYGVIVSIDSRGAVTAHLPRGQRRAAELAPGGNVALPTAYQLDDAPRWEAFYIVAAPQPFDVDVVVAAARAAAAAPANGAADNPARLALPAGFEQSAFLLKKDMPR